MTGRDKSHRLHEVPSFTAQPDLLSISSLWKKILRFWLYSDAITVTTMYYTKVAMGSWKQEFFIFEIAKYLEYLDTDKMGGKVEKSI